MSGKVEPLRKPVKCPNCDSLSGRETYPFCSKRCSEADLHRWFSGLYSVPAHETIGFDED